MKFSIRDLLLVTVIVALAVGWWVDRNRLTLKLSAQDSELVQLRRERENWPQVTLKNPLPPGMKLVRVPLTSSAPAPNQPKP